MQVFLSPIAERKLELLLEYLESNWSRKTRDTFLSKLLKSFERVSEYPKSCPESQEFKNLFKCTLTKQTSYYYRIKSNEIQVITITDNRQDPDKILEEIKHWR